MFRYYIRYFYIRFLIFQFTNSTIFEKILHSRTRYYTRYFYIRFLIFRFTNSTIFHTILHSRIYSKTVSIFLYSISNLPIHKFDYFPILHSRTRNFDIFIFVFDFVIFENYEIFSFLLYSCTISNLAVWSLTRRIIDACSRQSCSHNRNGGVSNASTYIKLYRCPHFLSMDRS